jgi:endonuclease YncB( thermonuclease family)
MKKLITFFSLGFLALFLFTVFETISSPANSQSQHFRVKSHPKFDKKFFGKTFVIDGDSINVAGKEVRLVGIDAPEYKQNCFDEKNEEYSCGQISRDFLTELIGEKKVTCAFSGKDKYERYLGKCFIGEVSINEEILKNGMAVIYDFNETDEKMEKLEAQAKSKKLGIWRGAFQLPKEYRKQNPRSI